MSKSKFKEVKDKLVGGAKEVTGKVTDNEKLELEGKLQKGRGEARGVVNDFDDKVKETKDKALGKINDAIDQKEENSKK